MFSSPKRWPALAVATVASLLWIGVSPAQAAPPPCAGVWVVVQSDEADPSSIRANCAEEFDTGADALKSAGFDIEQAGPVVSRIGGLPQDADFNTNGGFYWSYWNAKLAKDGALGAWSYYQVGADLSGPKRGRVEGWLLTNRQDATGPVLTDLTTALPDATGEPTEGATSAAPTESPASPEATATAPAQSGEGAPIGAIVGGIAVVVALAGLGTWWFTTGRKR